MEIVTKGTLTSGPILAKTHWMQVSVHSFTSWVILGQQCWCRNARVLSLLGLPIWSFYVLQMPLAFCLETITWNVSSTDPTFPEIFPVHHLSMKFCPNFLAIVSCKVMRNPIPQAGYLLLLPLLYLGSWVISRGINALLKTEFCTIEIVFKLFCECAF